MLVAETPDDPETFEQLRHIQKLLADVQTEFQSAATIEPEVELVFEAPHPFGETFEEEEVIADRYAAVVPPPPNSTADHDQGSALPDLMPDAVPETAPEPVPANITRAPSGHHACMVGDGRRDEYVVAATASEGKPASVCEEPQLERIYQARVPCRAHVLMMIGLTCATRLPQKTERKRKWPPPRWWPLSRSQRRGRHARSCHRRGRSLGDCLPNCGGGSNRR